MNFYKRFSRGLSAAGFMVFASVAVNALGAGVEPVQSLAMQEKPALIETLKELVSIESGSTDIEGLDKLARLIVGRLQDLGGTVEVIEPGADVYRMHDTPEKIGRMVRATFSGTGPRRSCSSPIWIPSTCVVCLPSSPSVSKAIGPTAWASLTTSRALL